MPNWDKLWYQDRVVLWPLIPLSMLYANIIKLRRKCYNLGAFFKKIFFATNSNPVVPIIVVGNITVGGTGKTPLVIHIAEYLIERGWQPGIISRGYKGKHRKPTTVNSKSDPIIVGDEALLFAKRLECPIVVGKDRCAALKKLLKINAQNTKGSSNAIDVVISDDGLQHYALDRHIEIAVVDAERRFGNGYCLPVGPLREPESRLSSVDLIIHNTGIFYGVLEKAIPKNEDANVYGMRYVPDKLYNAFQTDRQVSLATFCGQTVHAIAGIGNPERFFQLLSDYGLIVIKHAFPDHHRFTHKDIYFRNEFPVIMTEKDAVKCTKFVDLRHWILPIKAEVDSQFDTKLLALLEGQYYG
ncbi:MAG TPA: tetraacyldisaccharide 4'-kinase [Gammaproteobacteria bacterium]|nr:tetraacyldisaccharide 4'-kinase [Gammaproteobacteria bacterium]